MKIRDIESKLKNVEIEIPHVFKKTRARSSKQIDITLATDMLTHAHQDNYVIAILVAGDEEKQRQKALWNSFDT